MKISDFPLGGSGTTQLKWIALKNKIENEKEDRKGCYTVFENYQSFYDFLNSKCVGKIYNFCRHINEDYSFKKFGFSFHIVLGKWLFSEKYNPIVKKLSIDLGKIKENNIITFLIK